jgi:hypothetical protein
LRKREPVDFGVVTDVDGKRRMEEDLFDAGGGRMRSGQRPQFIGQTG